MERSIFNVVRAVKEYIHTSFHINSESRIKTLCLKSALDNESSMTFIAHNIKSAFEVICITFLEKVI